MKKKNKVLEEKKMRKRENKNLLKKIKVINNIETEEKNLPRNLFSEDIEEDDDNNNENNNELNINDLNNKNNKESNINNENNNEKNNNIITVLPEEIDLTKFN